MTLDYDEEGVPVLSRIDIEETAEKFLQYFDESPLKKPMFTPILAIKEKLEKNHGVTFIFNQDLGSNSDGNKYLGRFNIHSNTIYIAPFLLNKDPRFSFTLAHELGHFVLHRKSPGISNLTNENNEFIDTKKQVLLDRVGKRKVHDWVEWQANKFAASFLIPRFPLKAAVATYQDKMGISKANGIIFLDDQMCNQKDFASIKHSLSDLYQTSRTVVERRLKELNLINDQRSNLTRADSLVKISDIFKDIKNST